MDERQHLSLRRLSQHRRRRSATRRRRAEPCRHSAWCNPIRRTQRLPPRRPRAAKYIAGGSDLLQLLKDNVESPTQLVDLEGIGLSGIHADAKGLRLEAMARMSDVAAHPAVRERWPVISEALLASASPQVRNMGTIGGNLLQRTRCGYFRDTGFACNKREPGSGCPAIHGESRMLAILGVSDQCIASHPSDLAGGVDGARCDAGTARRQTVRSGRWRLPISTGCPAIRRRSRPCLAAGRNDRGGDDCRQSGGAAIRTT